jgi:hypothetical protein
VQEVDELVVELVEVEYDSELLEEVDEDVEVQEVLELVVEEVEVE